MSVCFMTMTMSSLLIVMVAYLWNVAGREILIMDVQWKKAAATV